MTESASGEIRLEVLGSIAIITLSNPRLRNAFDAQSFDQMRSACDAVDGDPRIGALVIRGDGGHFCSGADRALLARAGEDPLHERNYATLTSIYNAVARVGLVAVPVIAAVRGAALGAGFNLALAADVRIVAHDARLMSGFQPIGMHPGGGHFHLLTRAASREAAAAIAFFGQPLSGDDALRLNLAWEAHPDAEVEGRAVELATIVAGDPGLARSMKRTLDSTWGATWNVTLDAERAAQMWALRRKFGSPEPHNERGIT